MVKTVNIPKLYSSDIYDSAQLMIWDTVEAAITIVAASIPVLRVLLRNFGSSMRKSSANDDRTKSQKSAFASNLSKGDRSNFSNLSYGYADNRSDKSILGEKNIKRTDTVEIHYGRRNGNNYEMANV